MKRFLVTTLFFSLPFLFCVHKVLFGLFRLGDVNPKLIVLLSLPHLNRIYEGKSSVKTVITNIKGRHIDSYFSNRIVLRPILCNRNRNFKSMSGLNMVEVCTSSSNKVPHPERRNL